MRKVAAALVALLWASDARAIGFAATATENVSWQNQFAGAVSWSTYGVRDDSGVTDNTLALKSIPGGVPIIADCPHGGTVNFAGTWAWPSGLTVWQQPGCVLVGTGARQTPIFTPISTAATAPTTNVAYYGLQLTCGTDTQAFKSLAGWVDHLKLIHFSITQCGGPFMRGSDREYAYGFVDTTPLVVSGNPGYHDGGNLPAVPLSPGMWSSVDYHNLYARSGDAAFQTCQPANVAGSYLTGVSTDGVLYRDAYANTYNGVILASWVGPAQPYYTCNNITYEHITGSGAIFAWVLPGVANSIVHNMNIINSSFTMTGTASNAVQVGNFQAAGITNNGTNMDTVNFSNINVHSNRKVAMEIYGCFPGITVSNSVLTTQANGANYPALYMSGTCGVSVSNTSISVGDSNAVEVGSNSQPSNVLPSTLSQNDVLTNLTISGVADGQSGIDLLNVANATVTGGSVASASGSTTATGVTLTANPTGTNNSTVTGVSLTGMPVPVVCASGQGNVVRNNPGASDCAP